MVDLLFSALIAVTSCLLPVARSQRARERSIRLFIHLFIVVNLPVFLMIEGVCVLAQIIDYPYFPQLLCHPSSTLFVLFLPFCAYLLTRNLEGKRSILGWKA